VLHGVYSLPPEIPSALPVISNHSILACPAAIPRSTSRRWHDRSRLRHFLPNTKLCRSVILAFAAALVLGLRSARQRLHRPLLPLPHHPRRHGDLHREAISGPSARKAGPRVASRPAPARKSTPPFLPMGKNSRLPAPIRRPRRVYTMPVDGGLPQRRPGTPAPSSQAGRPMPVLFRTRRLLHASRSKTSPPWIPTASAKFNPLSNPPKVPSF